MGIWVRKIKSFVITIIITNLFAALHFSQFEIIPYVRGSLRWNKTSTSSDNELAKGVLK